jgi:hypothetical protein
MPIFYTYRFTYPIPETITMEEYDAPVNEKEQKYGKYKGNKNG